MAKQLKRQKKTTSGKLTLRDVCGAFQTIAPLELAQSWDNVGLLAGDENRPIHKLLLCIDLTPPVAVEAIKGGYDLVLAYHPPIFKPISRLTAACAGPEAAVFRLISAGIAVYTMHTALDAADGGTNDVLAAMCGAAHTEPLEYVDRPGETELKFVTFVPPENLDAVADALAAAGAGRIGEYARCSYRLEGYGTFQGSDATNPAIGQAGVFERVNETRIEMVCPASRLPAVTAALRAAHPYEEPAFDIYPLKPPPIRGIGRIGTLQRPTTLAQLAKKLKRAAQANCVQIVGDGERNVARVICVVGAAGSLPFRTRLRPDDVIVTGEIRHHDALTILRKGCTAIAMNHWTSERPALKTIATRVTAILPKLVATVSNADCEPFRPV